MQVFVPKMWAYNDVPYALEYQYFLSKYSQFPELIHMLMTSASWIEIIIDGVLFLGSFQNGYIKEKTRTAVENILSYLRIGPFMFE